MRKLLGILSIVCVLFFSVITDANAAMTDKYQVRAAADKVSGLAQYDVLSFVNRNELIGYMLDSFNLRAMEYQRIAQYHAENMYGIATKIEVIENSADFSDTDKELQCRQLCQNADAALSDLNSKTISYLIGLRDMMPTITYQRYVKRFLDYYNDLDLTEVDLKVKSY